MVGAEAGVDERIFAALRLVHRELPLRGIDREYRRGGMLRAAFAKGRIVRRTNPRGVPDAAGSVEHRIVRNRPAVPNSLLTPIWRWGQHGIVVSRRSIGITYGRFERRRGVMERVEHRKIIGAQFRRAIEQAVAVDGGVPPIGARQIVQIGFAVRPVSYRSDDVAFDAARTRGRQRGYFACGDAVGPIGEVRYRDTGERP